MHAKPYYLGWLKQPRVRGGIVLAVDAYCNFSLGCVQYAVQRYFLTDHWIAYRMLEQA